MKFFALHSSRRSCVAAVVCSIPFNPILPISGLDTGSEQPPLEFLCGESVEMLYVITQMKTTGKRIL